jgi:hypothetical protein
MTFSEHYFEMSHVDAKDALQLYRRFCKQTEHVVEFLGVAKKLQNLLNVPIPNLKHVSSYICLASINSPFITILGSSITRRCSARIP